MAEYDSVIPPGGAGKVTAAVKTDHLKGPVVKSVTVNSNDPANKTVSLQMKANVLVAVDVQPSESVFMQGKQGEIAPSVVTVSATDGQPFDILSVTQQTGDLIVSVKAAPPAAGAPATKPVKAPKPPAGTPKPIASGSTAYTVTLTPPANWSAGRKRATVELKTSHPKAGMVMLNVNANVTGDVIVSPERVALIARPDQPVADLVQKVRISKEKGTLKILKVESDDPDVDVKLVAIKEGSEYDVEVRYKGKPGRGALSSNVTVTTTEPQQKQIVIQVFGRI